MRTKVLKIGGSVLANTSGFQTAIKLVKADPDRRYVIVSALGKDGKQGSKITALLRSLKRQRGREKTLEVIKQRHLLIAQNLKLGEEVTRSIEAVLEEIRTHLTARVSARSLQFIMSRGEYLSAIIMAAALGWPIVDAGSIVRFTANGRFIRDFSATDLPECAVIPGFYGTDVHKRVWLLPPNGSDITGACAAASVGADLYEVAKDVGGIYPANPSIVKWDLKPIPYLSFVQAEELTHRGEPVLHDEAIALLNKAEIPARIFNAETPSYPGTLILPASDRRTKGSSPLLAIGEEHGFIMLDLHRSDMNKSHSFTNKLTGVLTRFKIGHDYIVAGKNELTIVIRDKEFAGRKDRVIDTIRRVCRAEVTVHDIQLTSICVVGRDLGSYPTHVGGLISALGSINAGGAIGVSTQEANPKIVHWQNQTGTGNSVIIGVPTERMKEAIRLLYSYVRDH